MSIVSREYLRSLKKINDDKIYRETINTIVIAISNNIIRIATSGLIEYNVPIYYKQCIPTQMLILETFIPDVSYIHDVVAKLKESFIDSDIEYLESKDIRGKVLESLIRIQW